MFAPPLKVPKAKTAPAPGPRPTLSLQRKVAIGSVNDPLEHEADSVAEQVMQMPAPIDVAPATAEKIRRAGADPAPGRLGDAPALACQTVSSPGRPLDEATRAYFEPRFGWDFSAVRVHASDAAAQSARSVNAKAYALGHHLVFDSGQFAPGTHAGRRLIAHELAHVVQQTKATEAIGRGIGLTRSSVHVARQPSPLAIPDEGVDMPWVGKGASNSSELGYLRDPTLFWNRFATSFGDRLSPANLTRIRNGSAPVVDPTWVRFYPQHAAYMNDVLEHHHVGQGSRAVPLPSRLHDAHTTFHPQRRVVGTPSGGTRPIPPQPTRADAQAQVDRHVDAGRIRGAGIQPGTPLPLPAISPASEVAGVPRAPSGPSPAAVPPRGPAPAPIRGAVGTVPVPAVTARPTPGRGAGVGPAVATAGATFAIAVLTPLINNYLQKLFAEDIAEEARKLTNAAITQANPRFEAAIATNEVKISAAQTEGRHAYLRFVTETRWQDTTDQQGFSIGNVVTSVKVVDVQVILEGEKAKEYDPDTNWAGDLIRFRAGQSIDYQPYDSEIPGTDMEARARSERTRVIEAAMAWGVRFEEMVIGSETAGVSSEGLREYAAGRSDRPDATKRGDQEYWHKMEEFAGAPIEERIAQAKVRSVSLAALRTHAVAMRAAAGESSDAGAGAHVSAYWSNVIRLIDAPLDQARYGAERQRFLWSREGSDAGLSAQRFAVSALEGRIAESEGMIAKLRNVDARTPRELAGSEPPHPPWAKINALQEEVRHMHENLLIERHLLRDIERR